MRTCTKCARTLPEDRFYSAGHGDLLRGECKGCTNSSIDDYRKRPKNKEKIRRWGLKTYHTRRKFSEGHKEKVKARNLVNYAVLCGNLRKGNCSVCGSSKEDCRIEAHHEDYNKPYHVTWLCTNHHRELHDGKFS